MLDLRRALVCFVFLAGTSLPHSAAAQSLYGSLVGNLSDPSGGAVAAARVRIVSATTNDARETLSNPSGGYSFTNLDAGTYTLSVSMPGFQSYQNTSAIVSIDATVRLDVTLQIGSVNEQVTVSAAAGGLQTDRSEVRHEITDESLNNLPTPIGRNYQSDLRLLPGFTVTGGGAVRGSNPSAAFTVFVNGAASQENNVRIDGATAANNFNTHLTAYVPGLEAIQTVEAVTSSSDASTGLAAGAAINVQVKSGTNRVHGSAFEYHTDNQIKARPALFPVGQGKPKTIFNQFGGTIGGPIKKDKLFYFLSYDGLLSRQTYSLFGTVPTDAAKGGDLTEVATPIYDPGTGTPDGLNRQPFAGNLIPTSRFSAPSQKILPLWPAANQSGLANNYFAASSAPYNRHTIDAKVNYNVSNRLTMFSRIGIIDWDEYYDPIFGAKLGGVAMSGQQAGPANGTSINLTSAATYVITPSLILDGYFGYNRSYQNVLPVDLDQKIGTDVLGIPGTNGPRRFEGGWPLITISGYNGIGVDQPYMPWIRHDPGFNYVANFNWTKHNHNIRFGGELARRDLNHAQPEIEGQTGGASGGFVFGQGVTQLSGGPAGNRENAFAAFLLGMPQSSGRTLQVPDEIQLRTNRFSAYVQDRWNVTPKLTITAGVRWEYLPLSHRPDRGIEFYDPTNNTQALCGYKAVPSDCGVNVSAAGFSPHAGAAYRASSTLVIRAGFGIARDSYDIAARGVRTNYPLMIAQNFTGATTFTPVGNWTQGIPTIVPPDYGDGIISVPATVVVHAVPKDIRRGYVESRNFTIQKEFKHGFVLQAGYVGTLIIRQFSLVDLNAGQVLGAGVAGEPLYAQFKRTATTPEYRPLGSQNYNALQVTLRRRFSHGLMLGASYAWSKAIGINSEIESAPPVQIESLLSKNRSVLNYDRTQTLHATAVWQLPFGTGRQWATSGVASKLLGGWQTNGIFTSMTGLPFSVTASGTSLNVPGTTQYADQVLPSVAILGGTGPNGLWFDPNAFRPVTAVRLGNAGRNSLRGPGLVNVDFGLFRDFRMTERVHLQFRGEAFNFTNTPHWGLPAANVSSATFRADGTISNLGGFGSITGTDGAYLTRSGMDERTFRLGLRLSF
jgi:Carboxypeptidase regulatory-like domain/TonB dependent receptor-like, beta-barrel